MDIAVLGTGMVGRAIGVRLVTLGHHVTIGTRNPELTRERSDGELSAALDAYPNLELATFAAAAAASEVVVNASNGSASLEVLGLIDPADLEGKVLVDVANPLDFSQGMPPTLTVKDTDSLAEQIQRAVPGARVVKTLNTMNASLMVDPALLGEETTVFVAGDDAAAKALVADLLRSFGHTDIVDLGDLSAARGMEMWLPLWLRVMGSLGTASFNLKIVRGQGN